MKLKYYIQRKYHKPTQVSKSYYLAVAESEGKTFPDGALYAFTTSSVKGYLQIDYEETSTAPIKYQPELSQNDPPMLWI